MAITSDSTKPIVSVIVRATLAQSTHAPSHEHTHTRTSTRTVGGSTRTREFARAYKCRTRLTRVLLCFGAAWRGARARR
eukprot:3324939-Prymnesium_polylepis.2